MAIDLDKFIKLRPYLYHVTARENLAALIRLPTLFPAAELMRRAGRTDLLRWRRTHDVPLGIGDDRFVLKDQGPLNERNIDFEDGDFGDFIEYLNEHVYFWPGNAEGPIRSGLRLHRHYEASSPLMLRVPTSQLFAVNGDAVPLFCQYNSGAPRQQHGKRVRRGSRLFADASVFPRREREVIEVAFQSAVVLPDAAELDDAGEWRRMQRAPRDDMAG